MAILPICWRNLLNSQNWKLSEMNKPEMISVNRLFPELNSELIKLLKSLKQDDWNLPTSSSIWKVKDIAAHLLDGDLRRLSFQRDLMSPPMPETPIDSHSDLISYLNHLNNSWVEVSKRLSSGVIIDLLNFSGKEICNLFDSLDPKSEALFAVGWAGEEKSQNWFDIAREYTERWYHQQQIREAAGRQLLNDEKWVFPLIDTFVRGLPNLFKNKFPERNNTSIVFEVEDIENAEWTLVKNENWELFTGGSDSRSAILRTNSDTAWRVFSKNISASEALDKCTIIGERELGLTILELTTYMK